MGLWKRIFGRGVIDSVNAVRAEEDTAASIDASNFDIFISYKSKDIDLARRLADSLITSGLKIWFAEWQIRPDGYDRFQETIYKGIKNCEYGLALINDLYLRSPHCAREIINLLAEQHKTLVVKIQDHSLQNEQLEELSILRAINCLKEEREAERESLADAIGDETSEKLDSLPGDVQLPPDLNKEIKYDKFTKRLVIKGVMSIEDKNALIGLSSDKFYKKAIENLFQRSQDKNLHMKKQLSLKSILDSVEDEKRLMYGGEDVNEVLTFIESNINRTILRDRTISHVSKKYFKGALYGSTFTLDISDWKVTEHGKNTESGAGEGTTFQFNSGDVKLFVNLYFGVDLSVEATNRLRTPNDNDRELYEALMRFASKYIAEWKADIKGLHLVFHSGFSQFALTYRMPGYWSRKYSIVIPHPMLSEPIEFVFTFGFQGSFQDYCRHTHIMDSFVESLKWSNESIGVRGDPIELTRKAFFIVEQLNRIERAKIAEAIAEAIDCLCRAIILDPSCGDAYNELSFIHGRIMQDLGRAEEFARRAIDCDPSNPKFWNALNGIQTARLANLKTRREIEENVKLRLEEIQQKISDNPKFASLYLAKASALALRGEPRQVWEAELQHAKQLYLEIGVTSGGLSATPEMVHKIIASNENECERMANVWKLASDT